MAYLGEDIKKLGFGLMRLPQKGGVIDVEQVKQMVDLFLSKGFTYFDTAWAYPGSEDAIRQALVERFVVQLQINYADWENPAIQSRGVYEMARKHGKPVIIMEPVLILMRRWQVGQFAFQPVWKALSPFYPV